jgi:hypothetical protein
MAEKRLYIAAQMMFLRRMTGLQSLPAGVILKVVGAFLIAIFRSYDAVAVARA